MKIFFLALILTAVTTPAFASDEPAEVAVQLNIVLESERENGVLLLTIEPVESGQLKVTYNPNVCTEDGRCSRLPVSVRTVSAVMLRNDIAKGGSMLLDLGGGIGLVLSRNIAGKTIAKGQIHIEEGDLRELKLTPRLADFSVK